MGRPYIPIYHDWPETTEALNDAEKGRLIDAIVRYARGEDVQELLKGNERFVWPMFRAMVDRAAETSTVRAAAGAVGGSKAKQSEANASKAKQTQANVSKTEQSEADASKSPNKNKNKNSNRNMNKNKNSDSCADTPAQRAKFARPTAEEVADYADSLHYTGFPAERFVAYYDANGWKVGREAMKDWRAAVRYWHAQGDGRTGGGAKTGGAEKNPALAYSQRSYTDADFEGLYFDTDRDYT